MTFNPMVLWLVLFCIWTNPSHAEAFKIKALTLNVWGLPGPIVKDAKFRFNKIRDHIESSDYDFVFLQEAFSPKAKINLRTTSLPYYVNGPRAQGRLQGSGLRILSKYKILKSATLQYADCLKDDCLARKGALYSLVELPNGTKLNLFVTHLNARGGNAIRKKQLEQLKLFINNYKESHSPVLLAGDFNFGPNTEPYEYILKDFELNDAWKSVRGSEEGFTYDTIENQYAHDYCIRHGFGFERDRIDFMFTTTALKALDTERMFLTAPLLSDHFGLKAEFELLTN